MRAQCADNQQVMPAPQNARLTGKELKAGGRTGLLAVWLAQMDKGKCVAALTAGLLLLLTTALILILSSNVRLLLSLLLLAAAALVSD